ncbi:uncharacterized protein Z519_00587 [Cladophialophora bantiana CBS 173.52]|uniref:Ankyrin repeat protein n=1 Tax=Cladophialophora bantiana (strain ATCC 10958 / CBS 173.52 / CDC B-1940 / NIH 8579) TaxID=1442370 RepID=A0A0D2IQ79_CLAB1|nr:uncharacterized protein Z519_00587 [Cladophialophora bantiana CBS 173.52]KIW98924.1 hypothetical protein Z519_00587 [Cladophialophora bantiana CBS 173.52]
MEPVSPTAAGAAPQSSDELPPEAIALAGRFFDAARSGQLDIFEQALPRGLPANLTNDKGDTLLMLASYHGHAPLASLLVQHGADPNRLNDRGQSILAGVVFKNEAEVIDILLEAGADPELGQPSALEATRVFRQEAYEQKFKEQVEKLKAAGARAINGSS